MKPILFLYEFFIAIPILAVLTSLTALTTIIGCALGNNNVWGYYPAKIWSRLFCFFSLVRVEITGMENINKDQSYIFISNHQGAYDTFLIYGYLNHNFKWIIKQGVRNMPLVGKACASAGHIFLERANHKAIQQTIKSAKEKLEDGTSLVIFPEGTRSNDGKLHKFKRGAFQLAVDINIPVVPLTINGSYKILPKSSFMINPGKMTLKIHPPIIPDQQNGHNLESLINKSYETIASDLEQS
ncbi:MAG: lysophospholipid acyltransferase family protein [Bacteroidales bacterium]